MHNKMNIKNNNFIQNKNFEMKIKYKISKNNKILKIFGTEFVKNNKNNIKMMVLGMIYELRDELNNAFWGEDDTELEVKIIQLNTVTNMRNMFNGCSSLTSISESSKWNTDNTTDMSFMFYGCTSLEQLPDFSLWNTNNVTDMSYMFRNCSSLKFFSNISQLNMNCVTDISYMFYGCTSFTELPDISNWNISNVKNMSYIFC